jgi:hypothetical protein
MPYAPANASPFSSSTLYGPLWRYRHTPRLSLTEALKHMALNAIREAVRRCRDAGRGFRAGAEASENARSGSSLNSAIRVNECNRDVTPTTLARAGNKRRVLAGAERGNRQHRQIHHLVGVPIDVDSAG